MQVKEAWRCGCQGPWLAGVYIPLTAVGAGFTFAFQKINYMVSRKSSLRNT